MANPGKRPLLVTVEDPPAHPGEICTTDQASVAITLDERFGKFAQDYGYRSADHRKMMGHRNAVESYNSTLKEEGHEQLGDGARRPVRGFAKQALLAALMVFSANIRAIETFVQSYREALSKPPSDPGPEDSRSATATEAPGHAADEPPPHRPAA